MRSDGSSRPDELENLLVERGTLTHRERLIINSHMVHTVEMLEALPFPPELARVPEYAGGHHERMDGRGYPLGIHAGTMSIPARIMAIADVFEALTAADRPYKPAKPLSATMAIMGAMKRDNHIDPDLFDLFVTSGAYRAFAREHLADELQDEVDEQALARHRPGARARTMSCGVGRPRSSSPSTARSAPGDAPSTAPWTAPRPAPPHSPDLNDELNTELTRARATASRHVAPSGVATGARRPGSPRLVPWPSGATSPRPCRASAARRASRSIRSRPQLCPPR